MKKTIILLNIFAILLLVGCGSKETNKSNNSVVLENQGEDLIEHDIVYEKKTFKASEEILNAELGSGLIQIGDSIVQLPIKVSDLTKQTNATYFSVDYEPNIMSNEHLLTKDDGSVIAGLNFLDADCTAVYSSFVPKTDTCTAGELYANELREITSENIILPQGIKIGTSLTEIKALFGDTLTSGYDGDEDTLEYKVRFMITDSDAIEGCNIYRNFAYPNEQCPLEYVGFLYLEVNRSTGMIQELRIAYAYDAKMN